MSNANTSNGIKSQLFVPLSLKQKNVIFDLKGVYCLVWKGGELRILFSFLFCICFVSTEENINSLKVWCALRYHSLCQEQKGVAVDRTTLIRWRIDVMVGSPTKKWWRTLNIC